MEMQFVTVSVASLAMNIQNNGKDLCNQQPEHYHQSHEQEEAGEELLVHILRSPWNSWRRPPVVYVECRREYTEGKGPDPKRHLEPTIAKPKALEAPSVFWLRSLSLRSWRSFLSGVLLPSAPPSIQRNNFISADSCFAHRAHLSVWPGL